MSRKEKIGLFVLLAFILLLIFAFMHSFQRTSSARLRDQYQTQIPQFHSLADKDGDGIDDQVDILQGALAYISTEPKYRSRYYNTGYPDDGYGVCTDVVAFAMRAAGYDLMELVNDGKIQRLPGGHYGNYPKRNPDSGI